MKLQAVLTFALLVAMGGQGWSQTILPLGAYDTNQDGSIGDSDAMAIIDYLGQGGTSPVHPGSTRKTYNVTGTLADYYGTKTDSYITALDAIQVINFINGTKIHRNPVLAQDVNNNGYASSLDALLIINYLNRNDPLEPRVSNVAYQVAVPIFFSYPLTLGYLVGRSGAVYYDVNGDYRVTSSDALAVVDWINAHP